MRVKLWIVVYEYKRCEIMLLKRVLESWPSILYSSIQINLPIKLYGKQAPVKELVQFDVRRSECSIVHASVAPTWEVLSVNYL